MELREVIGFAFAVLAIAPVLSGAWSAIYYSSGSHDSAKKPKCNRTPRTFVPFRVVSVKVTA